MNLLEDIKSGKYNLILFTILFILVFKLFMDNKLEHLTNTDEVRDLIFQTYKVDVAAIKNLSDIATQLQKGGLTIPGDLKVLGELNVQGPNIWFNGPTSQNIWVGNRDKNQWLIHTPPDDRGLLTMVRVQRDGNVNWNIGSGFLTNPEGTQITNLYSNLISRGIIVSWTGDKAPAGWALCDGQNGTPDLRNRFILGLNPNGGKHSKVPGDDYNKLGGIGGSQVHQLTEGELAKHSHWFDDAFFAENDGDRKRWGNNNLPGSNNGYDWDNSVFSRRWNTDTTGNNEEHNNMPPYYILAFIMKL